MNCLAFLNNSCQEQANRHVYVASEPSAGPQATCSSMWGCLGHGCTAHLYYPEQANVGEGSHQAQPAITVSWSQEERWGYPRHQSSIWSNLGCCVLHTSMG